MKDLLQLALKQASDAELYMRKVQDMNATFTHGVVKDIDGSSTTNIALRANINGRVGSAVSTSLEDKSIVDRAVTSSLYKKEETLTFSNHDHGEVDCFDQKVVDLTAGQLKEEGQRIIDLVGKLSSGSIVPVVMIEKQVKEVAIVNSAGLDARYTKTEYSVSVITQSPKGFMEVVDGKVGSHYQQFTEAELEDLVNKHNMSQNRVSLTTGHYPVVFSGRAMGSLMTRLLAGVNAGNLLKKVSPLEGKMDELITSSLLTVYDDGTYAGGKDSCPFDDEGVPTQKTTILDKGVLKSYLATTGHGEKLDMTPTGNGFKKTMFSQDIEDQPAVCASNFIVAGSTGTDEELLAGIDKGLYIDGVMGTHTGNINGGEYSLNISRAYLIEDGKLTSKVVNTMVAGNIYDDFKKIVGIGQTLQPMQVVFYPMGYSPAVRFETLSIVGAE